MYIAMTPPGAVRPQRAAVVPTHLDWLAAAPTKTGFTFEGWNYGMIAYSILAGATDVLDSDGKPILFTAQWSANDAFTYNTAGGSTAPAGGVGVDGTSIKLAGPPNKTGFTFGGWNDGAATYGAGATYVLDSAGAAILFTAQWTANTVTDAYSYNTAGGSTAPAGGSGANGTSIGWLRPRPRPASPSAGGTTAPGHLRARRHLRARQRRRGHPLHGPVDRPIRHRRLQLQHRRRLDGPGRRQWAPTAPRSCSGLGPDQGRLHLRGWNDGAATYGAGATYVLDSAGAAILFTAQWTANTVTDAYSYNTAGGSTAPAGGSGANGTSIVLASAPTKAGFTFGGWNDGAATYGAGATYVLDSAGAAILFTAQWTANTVTDAYSYNTAGGSTAPAGGSGADGTSIVLAAAPTKAGFTFGGWNDGAATYGAGATYVLDSAGAAILFTAQWTANTVTDAYSYNTAGGSTAPAGGSGANGTSIVLASAPTKAGFTFGGWNDGAATYGAGATYVLDSAGAAILFTAQWTANTVTDAYSYNTAGGSTAPAGGSGANGTSIVLAAAPTKAGFTFGGWNDGAATYGAGATYVLDSAGAAILFTAQWTANTVTDAYSYNTAGGSTAPAGGSGANGTSIVLAAAPTKAGFTFGGWNDGAATYGAGATYVLDSAGAAILFTAQWTANTVTDAYSYNTAGGSTAPAGGSGANGTSIVLAAAPTKAGFTFGGWNDGAATYGAGATYVLDSAGAAILFTAQWTANTVTDAYSYNTAGGSTAPAGGSGANGTSIVLASAPTKAGFTFGGWNDGAATYGAGATYVLDSAGAAILFTAQWTANTVTDAYSYNTAGGSTAPAGGSGANGTSIVLASAPTKAGFTFGGWNDGAATYGAGATYCSTAPARPSSSRPSGRPIPSPTPTATTPPAARRPRPAAVVPTAPRSCWLRPRPRPASPSGAGTTARPPTGPAPPTCSTAPARPSSSRPSGRPIPSPTPTATTPPAARRPRPAAVAPTAPRSCWLRPRPRPASPSGAGTTARPPTGPAPPTCSTAPARPSSSRPSGRPIPSPTPTATTPPAARRPRPAAVAPTAPRSCWPRPRPRPASPSGAGTTARPPTGPAPPTCSTAPARPSSSRPSGRPIPSPTPTATTPPAARRPRPAAVVPTAPRSCWLRPRPRPASPSGAGTTARPPTGPAPPTCSTAPARPSSSRPSGRPRPRRSRRRPVCRSGRPSSPTDSRASKRSLSPSRD